MGKSADSIATREQVYRQLARRFPPDAISWVRTVRWDPATKIDLDDFDTSSRADWAATAEPKRVAQEVQKWQTGEAQPAVAVQVGNSPRLIIVDGHHRFIAREQMHKHRMLTWVGHVPNNTGPWMETHLSQSGGSPN